MASRRRKAPRKARKGHPERVQVSGAVGLAGFSSGRAGTPPTAVPGRRRAPGPAKLDADAGKFLSPEQQYLLRKRREVEQRAAKRRRSLAGMGLLAAVLAGAGVAWAVGWF